MVPWVEAEMMEFVLDWKEMVESCSVTLGHC